MPTINFTKKTLAELTAEEKPIFYNDERVKELYFRVGKNGVRTFYYYKRLIKGQSPKRFAIGKFPEMSIDQARIKALSVSSKSVAIEEAQSGRADMTVGLLYEKYFKNHASVHLVQPRQVQKIYSYYLKRWVNRTTSSITRLEVQEWVNEMKADVSNRTAYNALILLQAMINWGIVHEYIKHANPCRKIVVGELEERERFLLEDEIPKLLAALDAYEDQDSADLFRLCLWTGARYGNVSKMTWQELDLKNGQWRIPAKKTKEHYAYCVNLIGRAKELLQRRFKSRTSKIWVFPNSKSKKGHVTRSFNEWNDIKNLSGIRDIRIHDLRRTFGSHMAIAGEGLPVIGEALGHKSIAATQRYARLHRPAVIAAVNRVASVLTGEM